jgi:hypothetical protein
MLTYFNMGVCSNGQMELRANDLEAMIVAWASGMKSRGMGKGAFRKLD